ncbi:MAG: endonuclease/exonuclease/phosphatase family protein [Bacteroidota bacterium]
MAFIIMAIRKEWKWLLVFGVCFAFSLPDLFSFFSFGSKKENAQVEIGMKIMTHNAHLMGYYDGENAKKNRDAILNEIRKVQPNILCLQECYWNTQNGNLLSEEDRNQILPGYNIHERTTHVLSNGGRFGLVIFSNYPVVSRGQVPFENEVNNFCIYLDVLVGSDTIRIYNAQQIVYRVTWVPWRKRFHPIPGNEKQQFSNSAKLLLAPSNLKN